MAEEAPQQLSDIIGQIAAKDWVRGTFSLVTQKALEGKITPAETGIIHAESRFTRRHKIQKALGE